MSLLYSPLVYAETAIGGGYSQPALPSTFVSFGFSSPTWNPFSSNANDRTEYWVDTAGTLTFDEAYTLVYGASGLLQYQALQLLSGGLTVTSTSASGINGIYATDANSESNIEAIQEYILTFGDFPEGVSTMIWLDMNGIPHEFTSTQFTNFAGAVATFVSVCTLISLIGQGTLPNNSVTIP
jgi:hypothetical protein